jgi:dsDNA-binding SOS-regulon protein
MHLYFSLQVGTAFAVTNWQFENLALHLKHQVENLALYLQRQIENLALHLQRQVENLALHLQRQIENLALHLQRQVEILTLHLQRQIKKLALQSYFSSLFAEQCQTSSNKKRYIWRFPLTWPNRSERSNC